MDLKLAFFFASGVHGFYLKNGSTFVAGSSLLRPSLHGLHGIFSISQSAIADLFSKISALKGRKHF